MKCFNCESIVEESSQTCSGCGKTLPKVCINCGIRYEEKSKFCTSCGAKLETLFLDDSDNDDALKTLDNLNIEEDESLKSVSQAPIPHFTVDEGIDLVPEEIEEEIEVVETENVESEDFIEIEPDLSDNDTIEISASKIVETLDEEIIIETGDTGEIDEEIELSISELKKQKSNTKYLKHYPLPKGLPFSFDKLRSFFTNSDIFESAEEIFLKAESAFASSKGGTAFIRGKAGYGKSFFAEKIKEYIKKTPDSEISFVVSEVNAFDFDYMIFISLINELMEVKNASIENVFAKLDEFFGKSLPKSKKECIAALLSLNFIPLKTKLPKKDVEYLISFMLYIISRQKPVVWIIDNADFLNIRSVNFFRDLKHVFKNIPFFVIFLASPEATVLQIAKSEEITDFPGFSEKETLEYIGKYLGTNRIPTDIEKELKKHVPNIFYSMQLVDYLKDKNVIFQMRDSWRFSKLPDNFIYPSTIEELIDERIKMLSPKVQEVLRRLLLLKLFYIPAPLFNLIFNASAGEINVLINNNYIVREGEFYKFKFQSMFNLLSKKIKIGEDEKLFYRAIVKKLVSANPEVYKMNKQWLLLSYINLGGIVDRSLNSFLFSSAAYMERLGFFEIAQRSYQTILSSFSANEKHSDLKILLEIKNAGLWRFIEVNWAKIFWENLKKVSHKQHFYHMNLISKAQLLLLDEKTLNVKEILEAIKQLHKAGCYEDEIAFIDRVVELLLDANNSSDAFKLAFRAYKIMKDIIEKWDEKGKASADFISKLLVRSTIKLAEVYIVLNNLNEAKEKLMEALIIAEDLNNSYFISKIKFLIGKIKFILNENWEEELRDGFYQALSGMDFAILRQFYLFFEEKNLENKEWIIPYLEFKNWINF